MKSINTKWHTAVSSSSKCSIAPSRCNHLTLSFIISRLYRRHDGFSRWYGWLEDVLQAGIGASSCNGQHMGWGVNMDLGKSLLMSEMTDGHKIPCNQLEFILFFPVNIGLHFIR